MCWRAVKQKSNQKICSPVTDNCPAWIRCRKRMAVEMISWPVSMKECCWNRGSNPRPLFQQHSFIHLHVRWVCIRPSYRARPAQSILVGYWFLQGIIFWFQNVVYELGFQWQVQSVWNNGVTDTGQGRVTKITLAVLGSLSCWAACPGWQLTNDIQQTYKMICAHNKDVGQCAHFPSLARVSLMAIWAMSWESLFIPYVNNKDTDQHAHRRSLISTFAVHCLR